MSLHVHLHKRTLLSAESELEKLVLNTKFKDAGGQIIVSLPSPFSVHCSYHFSLAASNTATSIHFVPLV